jgi:nuclear GTP-binding protein
VEVILNKTDHGLLMKLYNIPQFADVREFLIRIALVRGRLGRVRHSLTARRGVSQGCTDVQGGIPDLEGSAVSVLRDWNSGKIPYYTSPPVVHPSAATARPLPSATALTGTDVAMGDGAPAVQIGGDRVLNQLSEAFTLDGLLDFAVGGEGEFAEEDEGDFAFE